MISNNLKAFLTMIAESEGTEHIGNNHGYDVIVGSTPNKPHLMTSYKDHPRIVVDLGHGLKSSAAGRYQILSRYYTYYKMLLNLPDFSPSSQDAIAIQMIKERKALSLIEAGNLYGAINACNNIWASLPGAGYGQHEHTLNMLTDFYVDAGGKVLA